MVFCSGSESALQQLELGRFDVVVSDMRMPGMDGAALLQAVKDRHPATARIILSGHAERESILKALPVAHQFLSKPCDAATVQTVVERACALQLLLSDDDIRRVIGSMDRLPSVPHTYLALCDASALPETGLADLALIVEQDPAMAVKVLQIVNSSYFGHPQKYASLHQAVSYLGTELLKGLALSAHVFMPGEQLCIAGFSVESLQAHSMRVAKLAKSFLADDRRAGEAFTAGIVHDIGKLVLARCAPEPFAQSLRMSLLTGRPDHEAERELLGTTHSEVGAYLLGLWGLPLGIVEAVAHHHHPERMAPTDTLMTLHAASALSQAWPESDEDSSLGGRLAADYIAGTEWGAELCRWRTLATACAAEEATT